MTARLISIGPSHYCEKARWALERAAIPYREEVHPPPFHALHTWRAGGGRTAPVLVEDAGVWSDSTDILRFIQDHPSARWRPYPEAPAPRGEVEALEDRFDEVLGPHARRRAYAFLLEDRAQVLQVMSPGAPRAERALFAATFPAIRSLMRRSMRIDAAGSERSRQRIAEVFDGIADRLADGRRYLAADRFTAADLTLASLAAPLLLPEGYGAPLPALDAVDAPLRQEVESWRTHPTGAFVLRLYAEERRA